MVTMSMHKQECKTRIQDIIADVLTQIKQQRRTAPACRKFVRSHIWSGSAVNTYLSSQLCLFMQMYFIKRVPRDL